MSLIDQYKRQFAWRSWTQVMGLLPPLAGKTVLDLGCGMGDQAAELAARGARVLGIDTNQELLAAAQSRGIPNSEFRNGDLTQLQGLDRVDGIWCSFAAAYAPDFGPTLASWRQHLHPQGWVALTEVDHLFGHEPVDPQTSALFDAYAHDALIANRYDFHMGGKLRRHLEQAGFSVTHSLTLPDKELAFDGPAEPEVLDAWQSRFDRMKRLRDFCGAAFEPARDDFLRALSSADHHSEAKVHCCIGVLDLAGQQG